MQELHYVFVLAAFCSAAARQLVGRFLAARMLRKEDNCFLICFFAPSASWRIIFVIDAKS
jgi:hypothetical protein